MRYRGLVLMGVAFAMVMLSSCGQDRERSGTDHRQASSDEEHQASGQKAPVAPAEGTEQEPSADDPRIRITVEKPISSGEALQVLRQGMEQEKQARQRGKATPTPATSLISGGNGILATPEIGLLWTRSAAGVLSLDDAAAYCRQLSLAQRSDWRLPTMPELERLVAAGYTPPESTAARFLWSSSTREVRGTQVLDLGSGEASHLQIDRAHVVCTCERH